MVATAAPDISEVGFGEGVMTYELTLTDRRVEQLDDLCLAQLLPSRHPMSPAR